MLAWMCAQPQISPETNPAELSFQPAPNPVLAQPSLPYVTHLGTLSTKQIEKLLTAMGRQARFAQLEDLKAFVRYDVDYYVLRYTTEYKGEAQEASALLALPQQAPTVPLLSFQHGTISRNQFAPSECVGDIVPFGLPAFKKKNRVQQVRLLNGAFASFGYVCVLPDYIGFGASIDLVHPYVHAESLAEDIIRAAQAAQEVARAQDRPVDGRLYLMGHSQGGYSTMATQRALEASPREGLSLQIVTASAGGYYTYGMYEDLISSPHIAKPHYLAYGALGYQDIYRDSKGDSKMALSNFFQEPYASRIPDLFDKHSSFAQINAQLTHNREQLLVADAFSTSPSSEYVAFLDVFKENSLTDWTPKTRLMLFHGTKDKVVPYHNSTYTYTQLSARAAEGVVSLRTFEGKSHSSSFPPYLVEALQAIVAHTAEGSDR